MKSEPSGSATVCLFRLIENQKPANPADILILDIEANGLTETVDVLKLLTCDAVGQVLFPLIHYAIFVAQKVNITATSRAGLVGSAILSACKATPPLKSVNGSIAPPFRTLKPVLPSSESGHNRFCLCSRNTAKFNCSARSGVKVAVALLLRRIWFALSAVMAIALCRSSPSSSRATEAAMQPGDCWPTKKRIFNVENC